ncbi:hypothetical protein RCC89_15835 [Cytophagaceae bacterium ABcell3]|nr:hypothetical protein RCC89_15835 [Cytophagaceae bacterium ABcell3]
MARKSTLEGTQKFRYRVLKVFLFKEKTFLQMLIALFLLAALLHPYPHIAMWLAFMFAGYSAIANDSIQSIGTFLASNEKQPWWVLWIFIAGIFVVTTSISWAIYEGDVSYERLSSKGFQDAPESFSFLQLAAPLVLLLLTRFRMPVSTTFLCLSVYSANWTGIQGMVQKSMVGYLLAFFVALALWFILAKPIKKFTKGKPGKHWIAIQWLISGSLWSVWIMQDGANIAVSLPRSLTLNQLLFFLFYITAGLGILFYFRGDKIQKIITEKSQVKDVRAASIIDLTYAIILYTFKLLSNIPMSTTWVFLGLMAGREIAMTLQSSYKTKRSLSKTIKIVRKDLLYAFLGLLVSITIAIAVNNEIRDQLFEAIYAFFEN